MAKIQPPADAAERIRAYAADGFTVRGIAMRLGVSYDPVFQRWTDEYPELKDAIAEGREQERHALHNMLYRTAVEGKGKDSLLAAMFLLKARHSYRDDGRDEQAGNRVSINFTLPGPQPLADFMVIENGDAGTATQSLPAPGAKRSRRG
ncbi:MAG: hypothetical protein ACT4PG_14745 [Panacagrimonas sp.]